MNITPQAENLSNAKREELLKRQALIRNLLIKN